MNDRYLYRAKRCDTGEWVEGNCINDGVTGQVFIHASGNSVNESDKVGEDGCLRFVAFEVDPSTICQCTGLKDKNGKLIWENDIVSFQFDNDDCPFPNKDTKKRIGKVFFSDFRASWSIAMGKNGSKSLNNDLWKYVQNGNRVEVIGSAIDNPELLGVGL